MRVKTQETQAVFTSSLCQRLAPFVVLVAIALLATKGANAAAITGDAAWSVETRQPQMEFPALTPSTTARVVPAPLEIALQRGQWSRACALAAQALAQSEQDVPALGTFAICAAITNHGTETAAAVRRLHQVEGAMATTPACWRALRR